MKYTVKSNYVDIFRDKIFPAEVYVEEGRIVRVLEIDESCNSYIIPGFVDAHIHIESSMLKPSEFSRAVVCFGTVATISDPHEIGNVMGVEGVKFMIEDALSADLKIHFGAPSCVPATSFETSGAKIGVKEIEELFNYDSVVCLAEMMNYPGVINNDHDVLSKLKLAKSLSYPIDGHAPGLGGDDLKKYCNAGITTDHECFTREEAEEKIANGMKIQIREGSGAKNFDSLIPLMDEYADQLMLCSDDLHPDDLELGHMNLLVKRALRKGYNLFQVLRSVSLVAVEHYKLDVGLLRVNDAADFLLVKDLKDFEVIQTVINGKVVYEQGQELSFRSDPISINNFNISEITSDDLVVKADSNQLKVIQAIDGELITRSIKATLTPLNGCLVSDTKQDVLKMIVLNRYRKSEPGKAFVKGFNLKQGAIASSIAHDSHNIICVASNDQAMQETVNWIIRNKGGIAVHNGTEVIGLTLDIAGIMSSDRIEIVAAKYKELSKIASEIGSSLISPFMTLAFMALLVIPDLKLSDKGLFDAKTFSLTDLLD